MRDLCVLGQQTNKCSKLSPISTVTYSSVTKNTLSRWEELCADYWKECYSSVHAKITLLKLLEHFK